MPSGLTSIFSNKSNNNYCLSINRVNISENIVDSIFCNTGKGKMSIYHSSKLSIGNKILTENGTKEFRRYSIYNDDGHVEFSCYNEINFLESLSK